MKKVSQKKDRDFCPLGEVTFFCVSIDILPYPPVAADTYGKGRRCLCRLWSKLYSYCMSNFFLHYAL